jgi:uncharacterized protein (TIGR00730 family)
MLKAEEDLLKKLSIADLERANAYAKDLGRGLQIVRSFPQGVTIFGSARLPQNNQYCKMAYELGGLLAKNGHAVITGGGPGIMEAANRGAFEYGGRSVGLNIVLSHEQFPNPYLTDSLTFRYFFSRKVMLAMASKCYAVFPGGFGTMDEFSEVLILMQEGKMPKMPLFLIGKSFWRPLDKFYRSTFVKNGVIGAHDTSIYKITDDINDVLKAANKIGHVKVDDNIYDHFKAV